MSKYERNYNDLRKPNETALSIKVDVNGVRFTTNSKYDSGVTARLNALQIRDLILDLAGIVGMEVKWDEMDERDGAPLQKSRQQLEEIDRLGEENK